MSVRQVVLDTETTGLAIDKGAMKTPSLRNVELTGPYFHTGSKATLEEIIHFYMFAGDYPNTILQIWGPDPSELISMPAFLKALTDDRVRFERAPFDHPELCVSIGHVEEQGTAVRTRIPVPPMILLTAAQSRWIFIVIVILLPLTVIGIGGVVWWLRR